MQNHPAGSWGAAPSPQGAPSSGLPPSSCTHAPAGSRPCRLAGAPGRGSCRPPSISKWLSQLPKRGGLCVNLPARTLFMVWVFLRKSPWCPPSLPSQTTPLCSPSLLGPWSDSSPECFRGRRPKGSVPTLVESQAGASQLQLSGHPELEGQCRSGDLFLRRIDQESTRLKPTPLLCSNGPLSKGHDPFQTELSEVLCSARGLSTSATETLPVRMEVKVGGGSFCPSGWAHPAAPSLPVCAPGLGCSRLSRRPLRLCPREVSVQVLCARAAYAILLDTVILGLASSQNHSTVFIV